MLKRRPGFLRFRLHSNEVISIEQLLPSLYVRFGGEHAQRTQSGDETVQNFEAISYPLLMSASANCKDGIAPQWKVAALTKAEEGYAQHLRRS